MSVLPNLAHQPEAFACRAFSLLIVFHVLPLAVGQEDFTKNAQGFRSGKPVPPVNDTTVVAEAEEFQIRTAGAGRRSRWARITMRPRSPTPS